MPLGIALEHIGVFLLEGFARHGGVDEVGDFLVRGPDVFQIDRLAVFRGAQGLGRQVDVHITGQRIGDNQGRGGEVVGAHVGADAPFEISVARQDGGRHQITLGDGSRDFRLQRAGVADAGGAAITDEVEADGVEVFLKASGVQVFRHDLASGGQRGFHPRLAGQAKCAGLAGDKARTDHHIGVRGVGARRDRGNHHLARGHRVAFALDGDFHALRALEGAFHFLGKRGFRIGQRQEVLRALGARDGGHDGAHVEMQGRGVDRVIGPIAPHAVGLGVSLNQRDPRLIAAGVLQVADGFGINREEATGGAVFGGHVGDGGAVGERQMV